MIRKKFVDFAVLGLVTLGGVLFFVVPLLSNRSALAAFGYLINRGLYVGLVALALMALALVSNALLAIVRAADIDLYELSKRPNGLTLLLAALRLNYPDNQQAIVRLGIGLAGLYLAALILLGFSVGGRVEVGYAVQLLFVGIPLLGMSILRLRNLQNRLGNMLAGRTYYLEIQSGVLIGGQPRLPKTGLMIGQAESNDIVLFNDKYVMPQQHVALQVNNGHVTLLVYGPAYVNQQPIAPGEYLIPPDTLFQVGLSTFQLKME
jgi:hypothetical protein